MKSEENNLARLQIIQRAQQELYATTTSMVGAGTLTPEIYKKVKKPFADTLYALGVKDCDTYLPSDEEVMTMIQAAQEAMKNKEPSPADQKDLSTAALNQVKAEQIAAEIEGIDPDTQLNYMSLAVGKGQDYGH
jgi:hypothetical protein